MELSTRRGGWTTIGGFAAEPLAILDEVTTLDGRDGPRDECGVFGVYAPGHDVSRLAYFALYALQHRGQESAGIAAPDVAGTS